MADAATRKANLGGNVLQKRRLATTDIDVSVIGLGTVKFGRQQGVKYPTAFQLPTDKEAKILLNCARDLGINLLDTAPAYGVSEERLGKLLQGERQEWIISTKAGEEFVDGVSYFDFSKSALNASVDRSLKRLKTDYLDILFIHSNGDDERIIEEEDVFATLARLKNEGKIRAFGMSTKTVRGGLLTIANADIAMVTFNPNYTDEVEVIHAAKQQQKAIFIKKAFASGHLQNVTVEETMQFIFNEPGVTSVIVGTINPAHLKENVTIVAG
ncbi:MAG: aldo/keto reductase [Gammaproteobacteria bacterium RIFCSPHIGHO2_12_FULL_40_19]|nr:MAG: aldo/keto reductase [Gammaproteobacteria bacterium RIFCSPHIGHO2_12_FULL_40_19]